ncbi:MAG: UDP-3-O-(3-hydroxymyristoyl)glucosamine N-acyltransferase [Desulfobacteraceae bacterium]|nr:UDP-3-O-(3-hydroxymyristoyl)glucosamine N-acyltransferase [Desulfobacteraceae bacterium]MCF8095072.1 UDP-3-O-(3-hydroxymyristoyl)glucosamine N-acyltransferase [Desulfobacteraceae bacterium]
MPQIKLSELLSLIQGEPADISGDPQKVVSRAAPFDQADGEAITFADNSGLLRKVKDCGAGAVIVPRRFAESAETNLVYSDNPRLAFARVMHYFYPPDRMFSGISPLAAVGKNFRYGDMAAVAPLAFIGDNVVLGSRAVVHPHACIADDVRIGDDTEIMSNVSISKGCVIGSRVTIQPGTVVGSDGFGYTPDQGCHFKIPQVGIVQIDDDVEIGACNTIDRATFGKTLICKGVKTDNQVHIAHNVTIGEYSIVVAQVGIAGSTSVGKNVILAGQAGIGGHISIGDGAVVGPQAGVARDVEAGKTVSGTPEMPHGHWLRVQKVISRLPEMKKQITDVEKRLASLEKSPGRNEDKE